MAKNELQTFMPPDKGVVAAPRFGNGRRGASILEMSVVLSILVTTTFGMLDVGSGVFRYNVLNHAARQGARRAIVHGTLSSVEGVWGPTTIGPVAATTTGVPIVDGSGPNSNDGIAKTLVGCDLAQTTIEVQWIDGGNNLGQRVRVTLTSPYKPFMTFLTPVTITAASTMQITH